MQLHKIYPDCEAEYIYPDCEAEWIETGCRWRKTGRPRFGANLVITNL